MYHTLIIIRLIEKVLFVGVSRAVKRRFPDTIIESYLSCSEKEHATKRCKRNTLKVFIISKIKNNMRPLENTKVDCSGQYSKYVPKSFVSVKQIVFPNYLFLQ